MQHGPYKPTSNNSAKFMKRYLILFAILFSVFAGLQAADEKQDDTGKGALVKTYTGILKTGIMAIGGETTGTTLKTKEGAVYELELGEKFSKLGDELSGKNVMVTGSLQTRAGVEVKERTIIVVTGLKAAGDAKP